MLRYGLALSLLMSAWLASPASAEPAARTANVVAVPVGTGSYASDLPPQVNSKLHDFASRKPIYVTPGETRPIPTNSWWTYLLVQPYGGNLWAYPVTLKADKAGFSFFYPTEWAGRDMKPDHPIRVTAAEFKPQPTLVKEWSDWSVTLQMADGSTFMKTTIGHGFPFAWTETSGLSPGLEFDEPVTFFDDNGTAAEPPGFGPDHAHIGILYHGRAYAVFAPHATGFVLDGNALKLPLHGNAFFVLAALPRKTDLGLFQKYAYAIPRKTQVAWKYSPADFALVLKEAKTEEVSSFGPDWANVALSHQQFYDPDAAAQTFDRYWDANEKLARLQDIAVLTYYFTHTHRKLGELQWDWHISQPTSATYKDARTGRFSYVVFNPSDTALACRVYEKDLLKRGLVAPPHALSVVHELQPTQAPQRPRRQ